MHVLHSTLNFMNTCGTLHATSLRMYVQCSLHVVPLLLQAVRTAQLTNWLIISVIAQYTNMYVQCSLHVVPLLLQALRAVRLICTAN